MIEQLVSEANGEWSNVFSKIFKILDDIIANDRKNIEIIFNSINRIAVAGLMSRKEEDATLFLRWASVNDSEVFKSVSNIVKMSNYTKALIQEIKDQTVYWEPILQKSTVFQQRPGIINAICEYCNSATAFEYATNYNLMHTAIYPKLFSECYQWRSDALFNLSMFINIKLKTPEAIDGMSPTLVEKFEILPQIIIKTLENNMKIVQHKKYVSFLESLEKKGSEKGRKFVLEIRRRWSVMRPLAQKQKPISNKPMK
ncbi:hypothetical protein GPJ56_002754 [Histomonas meleagridis]|uniref:uncharacterized protein n=1 Tax=Histomonas meleagridis TaxID=135588 RepID=UPI003559E4B6|nr:hypothetical protein GPJ56_002754 [Histomonas meleagridis]KAH0800061.1 hypothetical protein GO595_007173 [Histomonas meleagridis]